MVTLRMCLHNGQMFYKAARVEYHPVGVVGAIVPWNYPFHNVFNPLTAALFAGNGLVIKARARAAAATPGAQPERPVLRRLWATGAHAECQKELPSSCSVQKSERAGRR